MDYIILSTVRTSAPGFLKLQNRMNVMLTRCRSGMVVVTQRAFLDGPGKETLLGSLTTHWEQHVGVEQMWVDAMEVADQRARLPDCVGRLKLSMPPQ